jgi:hypothetical protein
MVHGLVTNGIRYAISSEDFVEAYQGACSINDVVDRLAKQTGRGVSRSMVVRRAAAYRRAGVVLKRLA